MAASAQIPQEQQRGSSGNKGIFSRCVCFTQQHTTVFEGAPRQILPSAVLLGDVDNDPKGDIELVVGGADGTLAVFKAGHPTPGPYLEASGLGTLAALGLGTLLLGHSDTRQLIAFAGEGVCHVFNIRPDDIRWDEDACTGRVQPLWSVPCPPNVTSCCIADVNGDNRQEVVLATKDGEVHVLSIEVSPEIDIEEGDQGTDAKDSLSRRGTISSTPRAVEVASSDIYSPSSTTRSRPETPQMEELALEQAEEWLAHEGDLSDDASRAARCPSVDSTNLSELQLEDGKGLTTPDMATTPPPPQPEDMRPRVWSERSHAAEEHDAGTPLNPHFRSLLELTAGGAVTSLSIVYYPDTPAVVSAEAAIALRAATAPADEGEVGAAPSPPAEDSREGEHGTGGDALGSSGSRRILAAAAATGTEPSPAGVYVAVGLEEGMVEMMRLSSRRAGTRLFDLVDPSRRSEHGSSSPSNASNPTSAALVHGAPSHGTSDSAADPHGPETPHAEACTAEPDENAAATGTAGGGDDGRFSLRIWDPTNEAPEGAAQAGETFRGTRRSSCDWRVPADKTGPALHALLGGDGGGLVVGLAASSPAVASVAATSNPTTPLSRAFSRRPRWGWGRASEGAATGRAGVVAGASGVSTEGEEGEQSFGVCTWDGRVGCCHLVAGADGHPQWRIAWTKQTEVEFFALQRLGYPALPNGPGQEDRERDGMLVACSWSGSTFIFDTDGTRCTEFDPEQFLKHPLTAFVAGDFTTSSGSTEPSLIYVSTGGDVVVYHGLVEQAEANAPTQFLDALHKSGSINMLRGLIENLAERLRWRSNQDDLLFPPPRSPPEAGPPGSDPNAGASASAATAAATAATGDILSPYEQEDSALQLPDAILARAVLCPAGITGAPKGKHRIREGGGGGSGSLGEERWRRETRALARGEGGTITVGEGASAAERVLREIKAWEARGRDPTLRNFPCLRSTLAGLMPWGSGPRRELLRNALKKSESQAEVCGSPA